nr:RNA-directed DNA polymerase, eukaryota [Tanacetum cinerariifolium]
RNIRGGAEKVQMASLLSLLEGLILPNMIDRWMWSISGDEEFSVSSVRNYIYDKILGTVSSKTQWWIDGGIAYNNGSRSLTSAGVSCGVGVKKMVKKPKKVEAEGSSKRSGDELEQESSKKQKADETKEVDDTAEMKRLQRLFMMRK